MSKTIIKSHSDKAGTSISVEELSVTTFGSDTISFDTLATTPANPAAESVKIYAKDDGNLYKLDENGTEVAINSGNGSGSLPLGAIVPIAANITGAMSIPASGTVDDNGFQYCDGASIAGAAVMSGNTPNLTGSIFLMGSTTAGATGGNNNSDHTHNVADHSHSFAHTHTISPTNIFINLRHSHTANVHTHTIAHTHTQGNLVARIQRFGSEMWYSDTGNGTWTGNQFIGANSGSGGSRGGLTGGSDVVGTTSGSSAGSSGSASDRGMDLQLTNYNQDHAHSTTDQSTSTTGLDGPGATLGASATDNRPNYISVVYVMRVK